MGLEKKMGTKKFIPLIIFIIISLPLTQSKIQADNIIPHYVQQKKVIKIGRASWYSEQDPGINKHTANNEIFDDSGLTAAMWDIPFNQLVKVTNLENGQFVIVRINDRGPHRRFVRQSRLIDLSKGAFIKIAQLKKGLINIQLELM